MRSIFARIGSGYYFMDLEDFLPEVFDQETSEAVTFSLYGGLFVVDNRDEKERDMFGKHLVLRICAWLSLVLAVLSVSFGWAQNQNAGNRPPIERLKSVLEGITRASDGVVGVAVKHLESGKDLAINGDTFFPMASVFKLPILVEVMAQLGEGKFKLSDEISLQNSDQFPEGSLLSDLKAPGVKLTVENVINMMMWLSDNTATDLLLNRVTIPAVNGRLRSYGLDKIIVSRTVKELLFDYFLMDGAKYKNLSKDELAAVFQKVAAENPRLIKEAGEKFPQKMADQATPQAINTLLEKIFKKEILDGASCDFILSTMRGCQTGPKRIRGLLPASTEVAHKTGTVGGTINDCGIIYLPDGAGHVALSVLSKETDPDHTEDTIALIAKTVYDFFCFAQ
jgi:beta-lactamase class A